MTNRSAVQSARTGDLARAGNGCGPFLIGEPVLQEDDTKAHVNLTRAPQPAFYFGRRMVMSRALFYVHPD
jgi:hypothetical protein